MGKDKFILYDGNCSFCKTVVGFIDKRDKKNVFRFNTIQSPEARALLRERKENFVDLNTVYFVDGTDVKKRSKAVFGIFSYLSFPYSLLSIFGILPVRLTDAVYKWIAKNRHRF